VRSTLPASTTHRMREAVRAWRRTPALRISGDPSDVESVTIRYLMYVLMPA
jgi:hypothetical protein